MKINIFCSEPNNLNGFVDGVKVSQKQKEWITKDKVAICKVADDAFAALRSQLEKTTANTISFKLKGTLSQEDIAPLVGILAQAKNSGKTIVVCFKDTAPKVKGGEDSHSRHDAGFRCAHIEDLKSMLDANGIKTKAK